MKNLFKNRTPRYGGGGSFFLIIILLAFLVAIYAFGINPDLGEKYTGIRLLKKPEPLVGPSEDEVTATGKVIDLALVAQHRDTWPAKVRLQKDHTFTLTLNGRAAGDILVHAGQQVNLLDISPTQLVVRYEAATAIIPPEDSDLIAQLNQSTWDWANRKVPAAPVVTEVDAGPGKKPMRSSTSGAMPQVESEIRAVLGSGSDIFYKDWSDPKEVLFEGKKHWEVSVTAGVITPGKSRLGRINHNVKVYFRDNKVVKVIDGGSGATP